MNPVRPLLLALSLLLGSRVAPSAPSVEGPSSIVDVPWTAVSKHAVRWLGRSVRFTIQFESRVATWESHLTRFSATEFVGLRAWSNEQDLWMAEDFAAPTVELFAPRASACAWTIAAANPHERYEVVGFVREVFLDRAWIEIVRISAVEGSVSEASVIHAGRALQLVESRAWELARAEFDVALAARLPERARTEFERWRALCQAQCDEQKKRSTRTARAQ